MCFTYEVLETFCNLPILAVNPKNCLHRTPHFPMTSQRAHPTAPNPRHPMAQRRVRSKHHTCTTPPTAPRSRLFTPLHPCRSMMPGTHRPITPRPRLFTPLHLCRSMAPCAYRPTAPYLRHTMLPSPTPLTVPHWAPRPLGTAPELPEVWKQKSDQNCNFFAIDNCRRCPNHGSSPENEAKRPLSASFPLYRRRERAANRKNVAKAPGFLFS